MPSQTLTQVQRAGALTDQVACRINDELTFLVNGLGHQLYLTLEVNQLRECVARIAMLTRDLQVSAQEMRK